MAESLREEEGVIIGSDESLKGDTFGGIVVAGVKADDSVREKLRELGAGDSKRFSDKQILRMAEKIRKLVDCEVKSIFPEEYNTRKVTEWLNKLHQEVYEHLKPGKHIVDKYPGCKVGHLQVEKAEDKYVEVGAASILARAEALKQMESLSSEAGFKLPLGSTHVKEALKKAKEKRLDFKKFVKVDFKNVKAFLES